MAKKAKKKPKAGRPPKAPEMLRRATNVTLDPKLKEAAKDLAFKRGESLSEMTERLLREEIRRHEAMRETP